MTTATIKTPKQMIAEDLATFWDNPLGYVFWAFPWGKLGTALESFAGPREWQEDYLCELGEQIRIRKFNGVDAVKPIQISTASGHGIGKSCLSAWLIKYIHDSRPHSKGCVTSNTSDQLRTKTWAELGKWHKLSVTFKFSTYNSSKGNMNLINRDHPESWRVDAMTCREENSEAFAGLHANTSTPFYLFDEASAIPRAISEVAQGGLTDGEPMFFMFGNPTKNTGFFRETFGKLKHRWINKIIDSRNVEGTNKELFREWIEDHGLDSDFVKVRVRGLFPNASVTQFIPSNLVDDAFGRHIREQDFNFAPVVIGVDCAWEGDDSNTIWLRQGLMSKRLWKKLEADTVDIAGQVARFEDEYDADAVNIDAAMGNGVIDILRRWKRKPNPIYFGGSSTNPEYKNKREQMWGEMKDWLKAGGCLPPIEDIRSDLTGPEYHTDLNGAKVLESKKEMKSRGLSSPDDGDGLGLTFAVPVIKKSDRDNYRKKKNKPSEVPTTKSFSYRKPTKLRKI